MGDLKFCSLHPYGKNTEYSGLLYDPQNVTSDSKDQIIYNVKGLESVTSTETVLTDATYINSSAFTAKWETDNGYLLIKNWPIGSKIFDEYDGLNGNAVPVKNIRITFLRKSLLPDNSFLTKVTTTYTENSTISDEETELINDNVHLALATINDNDVDVINLYGKGEEYSGFMLDYIHSDNLPVKSSVKLKLNDNNTVTYKSAVPGMLHIIENASKYSFRDYPNQLLFGNPKYEDYIIVSREECESIDFEKLQSREEEYDEYLYAFVDRIKSGEFKTPKGSYTYTLGDDVIWDRDDFVGSSTLNITVEPHYLIPVQYLINTSYSYIWPMGDPNNYIYIDNPIEVKKLSVNIPGQNHSVVPVEFEFILSAYGNHILNENDKRHLFIKGQLKSNAENNVRIYIARGDISQNYDAESLNDTENGHSQGVLLSNSKYEYNTLSSLNHIELSALAESADTQNVSFLVPDEDIPGSSSAINNTYTLYCSYLTADGNKRFRVLTTLTDQDISTNVNDIKPDKIKEFKLEGSTITSLKGKISLYDSLGRKIGDLTQGASIELTSGVYVLKCEENVYKIVIKQ